MSKKLIVRVLPGVELTWAILVPTREFRRLDLPTLERPRKAISGTFGGGNCERSVAETRNLHRSFIESWFHFGTGEEGCAIPALSRKKRFATVWLKNKARKNCGPES